MENVFKEAHLQPIHGFTIHALLAGQFFCTGMDYIAYNQENERIVIFSIV